MSIIRGLNKRADSKCKICWNDENLKEFIVLPAKKANLVESILACSICLGRIENSANKKCKLLEILNDLMQN